MPKVPKVLESSCRVPRDAIPPTPPGPEGSNGNGLVRVQRGARYNFLTSRGLARDPYLNIAVNRRDRRHRARSENFTTPSARVLYPSSMLQPPSLLTAITRCRR